MVASAGRERYGPRVSQPPFQQRRPPGHQPRDPHAARPAQDPYAGQHYSGDRYAGETYSGDEYAGQQQYAGDDYAVGPYAGQQYAQPEYQPRQQPEYAPREQYARRPERAPQRQPMPEPEPSGGGFRLPGLGLLFTIAGLAVQAVSLFLLPWLTTGNRGQFSLTADELWQASVDFGTQGFGGWYLVLFSYPLAALSIVLALAAVFESVALKVVWAGLTLIGLGYLVLRFGLGPVLEKIGGNAESVEFSRLDVTIGIIALSVLVVVVFLLKTAVAMFRRFAVLILLVLAGVHIYAVTDIAGVSDLSDLSFGAFGPALGYVLCAAAALMPRRLPGL